MIRKINHKWLQRLLLVLVFCLNLGGYSRILQAASRLPEAPTTFYYDETNTLDETTRNLVQKKNQFYQEKSAAPQVILAMINSTGEADIDEYAADLFQKWQIGNKSKNNGVLILYAVNQGKRNVRIEVGYGLEGDLPDALAGKILRDHKKQLKSNSPDTINQGLREVFQAVAGIVDQTNGYKTDDVKYGNRYQDDADDDYSFDLLQRPIFVVLFVLVIAAMAFIKPRYIHRRDGLRHSLLWWLFWLLFWNNNNHHHGGSDGGFWDDYGSGGGFSGGGGSSGGGGASI